MQGKTASEKRALSPGTPEWITIDLVELTISIWGPRYEGHITVEDAVTILRNLGQLLDVLKEEEKR